MPRAYALTWEPKLRRWRKDYKGKTYTISCRQLGVVETKDASYQKANEWWEDKRREIDAVPSEPNWEILSSTSPT